MPGRVWVCLPCVSFLAACELSEPEPRSSPVVSAPFREREPLPPPQPPAPPDEPFIEVLPDEVGEFVLENLPEVSGNPPPVSGGHIAVAPDGNMAAIAAPDRDALHLVDLQTNQLTTVPLPEGSEPGRALVVDDDRAVVALRQSGELAFVSALGTLEHTLEVCAAPRGLALDLRPQPPQILVACASGELVTVNRDGTEIVETEDFGPDLRDVAVVDRFTVLSRFRSAELYIVELDQTVVLDHGSLKAAVAWRMQPMEGSDGVTVLHQAVAREAPVSTSPGGYGVTDATRQTSGPRSCAPVVEAALTDVFLGRDGAQHIEHWALLERTLAVDFAHRNGRPVVADAALRTSDSTEAGLVQATRRQELGSCGRMLAAVELNGWGRPVDSVASLPGQRLLAVERWPTRIVLLDGPTEVQAWSFPDEPVRHPGQELFHTDPGAGVACASCHPEGMEDGLVWRFEGIGHRRTQYLRGGLEGTAPFHWDGDMNDFGHLMEEVMGRRMGAGRMPPEYSDALFAWLDQLPLFPAPKVQDDEAVARGEAIFHRDDVGCDTCHAGVHLGGIGWFNVGTGGVFQTPRLTNLSYRLPLMHTGCASTIGARFENPFCGGRQHGTIVHLSDNELEDLTLYLGSL